MNRSMRGKDLKGLGNKTRLSKDSDNKLRFTQCYLMNNRTDLHQIVKQNKTKQKNQVKIAAVRMTVYNHKIII